MKLILSIVLYCVLDEKNDLRGSPSSSSCLSVTKNVSYDCRMTKVITEGFRPGLEPSDARELAHPIIAQPLKDFVFPQLYSQKTQKGDKAARK